MTLLRRLSSLGAALIFMAVAFVPALLIPVLAS